MVWCVVLATVLWRRWQAEKVQQPIAAAVCASLAIFTLCWLFLASMGGRAEDKSIVVWVAILALLLPTAYFALAPAFTPDNEADDKTKLILLLGFVGLLTLLAPMFFYIKGAFSGDYRHQDTVFKFVLQAWLLLGTAAACGALAWWSTLRSAIRGIVCAVFVACWTIPFICSAGMVWARTISSAQRDPSGAAILELDGARHIPPDDRKAMAWLASQAKAGESVLESVGAGDKPEGSYNEFGRVAALTGVPTPLGWPMHTMYWGADYGKDVIPRWESIKQVYQWPGDSVALPILKNLKVRYIFAGELERNNYGLPSLMKMKKALPVVFESGETFIVAVPPQPTQR
jgi:uncharacterized membrane protein